MLSPTSVAEFRDAYREAAASEVTTVIHVRTDLLGPGPSGSAWWDVPVAEVSTLPSTTRRARAEYVRKRVRQRPFL